MRRRASPSLGCPPSLKVTALHDVKKSLSPMIQVVTSPLRELLREDADWNQLLRDMTERVTWADEEVSEFDGSFDSSIALGAVPRDR